MALILRRPKAVSKDGGYFYICLSGWGLALPDAVSPIARQGERIGQGLPDHV